MCSIIACDPTNTRGRQFPEVESAHRSPFQRDRDRIIHSAAFRRLKHKTQVFVAHEGDHFRTRLTHTIEVGQVARTLAKVFGLNIELTEAIALAHDLGHTPFGHTGEDALAAAMAPYGGFDHNAQALKIVTNLERHYAGFDGMNLTWETLEGIAKHNGPVLGDLPYALSEFSAEFDLELHTHASAEAQVAAIADDIAYNNHDLDDGLRAGSFCVEELLDLPIVGACFAQVDALHPGLDPSRRRHEALRRVFGVMVDDVIRESKARIEKSGARSAQDIRAIGAPVVQFSSTMWQDLKVIRAFLFDNMYRSPPVVEMRKDCAHVVGELFARFMQDNDALPKHWDMAGLDQQARARRVSDYLSGMTDGYALGRFEQLFGRSALAGKGFDK
ncbi:deoxyguanosinetriphosphate triphosphohydrolase-like protein [Amylibacter marinus]|uniref:Deoxyguanosinetriphosphate triphosphohydrolase-like protein n=1 Tax=Amylibacter marinus TaxID=1475483 RepID=A0ABQ5VU64_9RHOB|nr:deoxyguanosinetriphosphate triphosphohydrolase [Amylibacter marinus]GLQ34811.1 deoxyguanosinetriphosphate triphosphohydrolase-like protein [Amylibacter marinus]